MQILIHPHMLHTCSTFQHKAGETGREWNGERRMHVATVTDEALQMKMKRDKRRCSICFTQKKDSTLIHLINYILFSNLGFLDTWSQDPLDPLHTANLMFYTVLHQPVQVYPVFCPMTAGAGLPLQTWTAYVVKTMDVWINVHKLQKGKYPSRIKKP